MTHLQLRSVSRALLAAVAIGLAAAPAAAQIAAAMGHPLPAGDLPNGTITVRLIAMRSAKNLKTVPRPSGPRIEEVVAADQALPPGGNPRGLSLAVACFVISANPCWPSLSM